LTAAVVKEFVTRTHYHVINQMTDDADAALHGTVLATYTTPLTYDSRTGRVHAPPIVLRPRSPAGRRRIAGRWWYLRR
jgi:hypothetical protein